jgi:preprotein translocase subunit SecE
MESNSSNSKIVTVSMMVSGILVGLMVSILWNALIAISTGAFGRFVSDDIVRHGLPVLVGLGVFLVLQFNKTVLVWADEVVVEVKRVVWPSRKDTTAMTIVVCVMLLISGVALGLLDVFSGTVLDWLLNHSFSGLFS